MDSANFGGSRRSPWKAKYADMEVSDVRRLKDLETENGKLKRIVADGYGSMLAGIYLFRIYNKLIDI